MWWMSISFVVIVFLYHFNFIEGFYIIDDSVLLGAPQVQAQIPILKKVSTIFTPFLNMDYYPLRDLSYLLDGVWGINLEANLLPAKLQNLFWFMVIGFLLYKTLLRFQVSTWWSGLIASLWLLHPYNLELLLWASARKDLLALAFTMAAGLFLMKGEGREAPRGRGTSWLPFLGAGFFFLCGALAKASFLLVPASLLVHFFIFRGSIKRRETLGALILMALLGLAIGLFHSIQYSAVNDMHFSYSLHYRIQGVLTAFGKMTTGWFYFPANVIDVENWGEWPLWNSDYLRIGILVVVLALFFVWQQRKNSSVMLFVFLGLSVYLLVPGPNGAHRNFYSTRYFTPIIILIILALAYHWGQRLPLSRAVRWGALGVSSLFLILVFRESKHWQSNLSIVSKAIAQSPHQANLLTSRMLLLLNKQGMEPLAPEEFELLKSDVAELKRECTAALEKERPNGSLCYFFWREAHTLREQHPSYFRDVTSDLLARMTKAYSHDMKVLGQTEELVAPQSNSITASIAYQRYLAVIKKSVFLGSEQLRAYELIDWCLHQNENKARQTYKSHLERGLILKKTMGEILSTASQPQEFHQLVHCFGRTATDQSF